MKNHVFIYILIILWNFFHDIKEVTLNTFFKKTGYAHGWMDGCLDKHICRWSLKHRNNGVTMKEFYSLLYILYLQKEHVLLL